MLTTVNKKNKVQTQRVSEKQVRILSSRDHFPPLLHAKPLSFTQICEYN